MLFCGVSDQDSLVGAGWVGEGLEGHTRGLLGSCVFFLDLGNGIMGVVSL